MAVGFPLILAGSVLAARRRAEPGTHPERGEPAAVGTEAAPLSAEPRR
jgi:hypothetical protein